MFAGQNQSLTFLPENGLNVLIRGEVSVFESYGQYQLYVKHMVPDGLGALHLAFEQLKERLNKRGYFSDDHKQPLPPYPKHIGIITSPTGAAIRDILTTLKRRYPIVSTTVYPVLVQGKAAAESIAAALRQANEQNICDVLIVGRGGGSIEELWSFNEANVAEAIFESKIPVISAVGHETDVTISDFVADVRAPTPTAAAEMAVPSGNELHSKLNAYQRQFTQFVQMRLADERDRLKRYKRSYALRYPEQLAIQKEQELDKMTERLDRSVSFLFQHKKERLHYASSRLLMQHPDRYIRAYKKELQHIQNRNQTAFTYILSKKTVELDSMLEKLLLLNPLEIMKRGYAIPYNETGAIIRTIDGMRKGASVSVQLSDGRLNCRVESVEEESL